MIGVSLSEPPHDLYYGKIACTYMYMYACMCVTIRRPHVHHTCTDAATAVLGKGRQPHVNSKYCSSKLQHYGSETAERASMNKRQEEAG